MGLLGQKGIPDVRFAVPLSVQVTVPSQVFPLTEPVQQLIFPLRSVKDFVPRGQLLTPNPKRLPAPEPEPDPDPDPPAPAPGQTGQAGQPSANPSVCRDAAQFCIGKKYTINIAVITPRIPYTIIYKAADAAAAISYCVVCFLWRCCCGFCCSCSGCSSSPC